MKKFTTLALAGAMTAAMCMSALADDALLTKTGNGSSAEKYQVDMSTLTEEQVASITKAVATVTVDSGYCNGTIGANVDGNWSSMTDQGVVEGESGTFEWEIPGSLVNKDDDGNLSPYMEVQLWWVNNIDDNEATPGTATVTSVVLYDADGNAVLSLGAAGGTGDVAPVAYLAALAAVAGVALVASKKARA